ncbi:MAG: 1-deoxy-D-xylulose-5-phosphate synthase [Lachnospiraceae bacterium]|nr:1-deoxy-D-xylulose-5-phosphate synthase [Lachnospiraceae bacterium]
MYLEKINHPNDIKKVPRAKLNVLAQEIREFLIESISETGGHLGANLGTVELTMALHLCLDFPEDKLIFDVGHQSYTHKILTGRREEFPTLRKHGGIAGFPKTSESDCDAFNTGHSSTSISAGLGMATARTLNGKNNTVVSVIGDGALTGGMAYEALNNAGKSNTKFIVVLNDNNMSISENVGGVSQYLDNVRTTEKYLELKEGVKGKLSHVPRGNEMISRIQKAKASLKSFVIPGMFFEEMGLTYLGPIDGHDISAMVKALNEAKRCKTPVLVHVLTKKGKGYLPAERHPARFHGAEPFEIETGLPKYKRVDPNYTDVFSTVMCKMGERDKDVCAITAAMPDGTGLKRFRSMYPDRFFDVGIAEEHAVTFAAGLAMGGLKPIVCIYSSFLQRAYDQMIHDVCIQNLHVVFAIDRAGIVGSDGETHQGIFDLSFLSTIPNMCVMAPKNKWELSDMMKFAVNYDGPVAIRYPRGKAYDGLSEFRAPIEYGQAEWINMESDICLLAVGSMVKTAVEVRDKLKGMGKNVSILNVRFVNPFDKEMILDALKTHKHLVTMEENVKAGGFGENIAEFLSSQGRFAKLTNISIPDIYVEHGNVDILKKEIGLDADSIVDKILKDGEGLS